MVVVVVVVAVAVVVVTVVMTSMRMAMSVRHATILLFTALQNDAELALNLLLVVAHEHAAAVARAQPDMTVQSKEISWVVRTDTLTTHQ